MKNVRSARLWFKEGNSDKVYEVDLTDLETPGNDARFLVNFRYGRRGASLREGTKTDSPVNRAEADKIFDSLVVSKENSGYRRMDQSLETQPLPESARDLSQAEAIHPRERELTARLEACLRNPWPPKDRERLFWRIGEVRLANAAPKLIALSEKLGPDGTGYCLVWALARCGGPKSADALATIAESSTSQLVKELASFALASPLVTPRTGGETPSPVPERLMDAVATGGEDALFGALSDLAEHAPVSVGDALTALYRRSFDDVRLRTSLLATLRRIPARPPYFKGLRKLFKYAEMLDDADMFGVLARTIEMASPMHKGIGWRGRSYIQELKESIQVEEERKKPNSRIALSYATLIFFKRRIWRALRKRGELGQAAYAQMATALLVAFDEKDGPGTRRWSEWRPNPENPRRYISIPCIAGSFSNYWSVGRILYRHATEIKFRSHSLSFVQYGDTPPTNGGEAFPNLWRDHPENALRIAIEARSEIAAEFGVRQLKANTDFLHNLDPSQLARLLASRFACVCQLAYDEARERLARGIADPSLLGALLGCTLKDGRHLAIERIDNDPALPWSDPDLSFIAISTAHADVQAAAKRWCAERRAADAVRTQLADKITQWLLALPPVPETADLARTSAINACLPQLWADHSFFLPWETAERLIAHPSQPIAAAGLSCLAVSSIDIATLPESFWDALIASPSEDVQTAGLGLLKRLDDATLLKQADRIAAFATSDSAQLRAAAHDLVVRLCAKDASFSGNLFEKLVSSLFRAEPTEGYADDTVALIRAAMPKDMEAMDANMLWRLLQAKANGAQRLGAAVLAVSPPEQFSVRQIARLGGHGQKSVRDWAFAAYDANRERFRADAENAVLIFDNEWEDAATFAAEFCAAWQDEAWTPNVLAILTDSLQPRAQAFGRSILRRTLRQPDAASHLSRLLEHPSAEFHLLITEVLTQNAVANDESFAKLLPLARIVLMQIAKGRVAKNRMLHILREEALARPDRAPAIAALLADLTLSASEKDRAPAILALRDIQKAHPGTITPLLAAEPVRKSA